MKGFHDLMSNLHEPFEILRFHFFQKIGFMFIDIWMQNPIKPYHKTTSETECFMLRPSEARRHPRMDSNASNLHARRPKDGLLAPQDGPKKLPRRPQDASKMTPDALRMVQTVPNCSKDRPDLDLGPSRPRFPTSRPQF